MTLASSKAEQMQSDSGRMGGLRSPPLLHLPPAPGRLSRGESSVQCLAQWDSGVTMATVLQKLLQLSLLRDECACVRETCSVPELAQIF